jgi:hypothetical protein
MATWFLRNFCFQDEICSNEYFLAYLGSFCSLNDVDCVSGHEYIVNSRTFVACCQNQMVVSNFWYVAEKIYEKPRQHCKISPGRVFNKSENKYCNIKTFARFIKHFSNKPSRLRINRWIKVQTLWIYSVFEVKVRIFGECQCDL